MGIRSQESGARSQESEVKDKEGGEDGEGREDGEAVYILRLSPYPLSPLSSPLPLILFSFL
jgi:hypothetical protein